VFIYYAVVRDEIKIIIASSTIALPISSTSIPALSSPTVPPSHFPFLPHSLVVSHTSLVYVMKRSERGQCMNRQTLGEIEDDGTPQNYKSDVGVQILCTGMGSRSFGVSDPLRLSTAQYAAERSIYSGMLVPLLPPTAMFFFDLPVSH